MSPTTDTVYSLARLSGRSMREALNEIRLLDVPLVTALGCALRAEFDFASLDKARILLPGQYYAVLQAFVDTYTPVRVLDELEGLGQMVSAFEAWNFQYPQRMGGNLAAFGQGFLCLAMAGALRSRGSAEAQRIFGPEGSVHAAGLRQALTMTPNRQVKFMRASLAALSTSQAPLAREAWRAALAWGLAMPTVRELSKELGHTETTNEASVLDAVEDELPNQYLLRMPLPAGAWPVDVWLGVHELRQEFKAAYRDLLVDSVAGRATLIPAYKLLGFWASMVGRMKALELVEAFLHQIVNSATPVHLMDLSFREDLADTLIQGLSQLRTTLKGTVEGQLLDLKVQQFADLWLHFHDSLQASNSGGGIPRPRIAELMN